MTGGCDRARANLEAGVLLVFSVKTTQENTDTFLLAMRWRQREEIKLLPPVTETARFDGRDLL